MRRVLKLFKVVLAITLLGILGLSGWLAFIRPELLQLVSAYAAKTVCSNVFIAKRDADAVIRTDVQFAEHRIVKLMKINIDAANRRVEAAFFGLFAKRYAGYAEGRGCTLVSKDENLDRATAPPLPSATGADALWPTGETAQLSDNRRLQAALTIQYSRGRACARLSSYMTGALSARPMVKASTLNAIAGLVDDENRQCRPGRHGDQGRQAFAGSERSVSAMGRGRARGYLGGRLDGHVQRIGIQRGPGPRQRRRAYGILGEGCGGFREG